MRMLYQHFFCFSFVLFFSVQNIARAEPNDMLESSAVIQQRAALQKLHAAVRVGDPEAVRVAFDAGVDVNQSVAFEMAILMEREEIIDLLIERGADVNKPGMSGELPITVAMRRGRPELMQKLLNRGADINMRDRHGKSALDHAQRLGKSDDADFLRRHGARDRAPGTR